MNILILNTVALNGGDGAILAALIGGLRKELGATARFVVHEAQPEVAARYHPGVDFQPTAAASLGDFADSRLGELRRRVLTSMLMTAAGQGWRAAAARSLLPSPVRRMLADYLAADLVITTGGTYLVENYDPTDRILSFDVALSARKPLVFYTQSLGTFRGQNVRSELRRILSRAELVLLRDVASRDNVIDLCGTTDHVYVAPDCVFALADPSRLAAASVAKRPLTRTLRVAISVRAWRHFTTRDADDGMQSYMTAIRAAATHLVEKHAASVTFLSTCQGIPEYHHDDSRTARAIVEGLPSRVRQSVTVDGRFVAASTLVEELAGFDFVIATRMHFAILALVAGVPVIPISYEFKTRELFDSLGQGRWVHDIESVEPERLVASIDRMVADESAVREALFASVIDAHALAWDANSRLADVARRVAGRASRSVSSLGPDALPLAADRYELLAEMRLPPREQVGDSPG